jgi:hypothetical protein
MAALCRSIFDVANREGGRELGCELLAGRLRVMSGYLSLEADVLGRASGTHTDSGASWNCATDSRRSMKKTISGHFIASAVQQIAVEHSSIGLGTSSSARIEPAIQDNGPRNRPLVRKPTPKILRSDLGRRRSCKSQRARKAEREGLLFNILTYSPKCDSTGVARTG